MQALNKWENIYYLVYWKANFIHHLPQSPDIPAMHICNRFRPKPLYASGYISFSYL